METFKTHLPQRHTDYEVHEFKMEILPGFKLHVLLKPKFDRNYIEIFDKDNTLLQTSECVKASAIEVKNKSSKPATFYVKLHVKEEPQHHRLYGLFSVTDKVVNYDDFEYVNYRPKDRV